MSGLLALLDDVAAIAKVAAASVDDVIGQATKAGAQAAGAVIDDAAVTPKYVHGFSPDRELPIVGRIAMGSIKNKLVFLLPAALLLSAFAAWLIPILLMIGGAYLCFEGAEKIAHSFGSHSHDEVDGDPAHLEEEKVQGAIKTDFILSAEIMTIALAATQTPSIWMQAMILFVVAIGITGLVYGAVAVIVKADDLGLAMARRGRFGATRAIGRALVQAMPGFLVILTWVGTAAMLWVGGSIIVHGLEEIGFPWLGHHIHEIAEAVAHRVPESFTGATKWVTTAGIDGLLGLGLGIVLIPISKAIFVPLWNKIVHR
ncbi:DUF808 domain-containing protein [Loktanella sp. S4079]|uniref:DUF808 domain-containing protein n=1 Tax=Loktanella sp. S4079 TaxID=579483 RepID=UPI0005FA5948|nr:DUF808 domain-containing protein [Loktanella sp. S4079]KJZ19950.1 ABC transporter [Loktanella sp. S4079]